MVNDLASPSDLADYPGAPFTDAQVDAAAVALRNQLGWHLAPVESETITLDHDGGPVLLLPSRRIVTVDEVRDVSSATPTVITDWRVSKDAGYLTGAWWPCGTAVIEVDLTHGYDMTPPDVFPAIAALCAQVKVDQTVGQVRIDDFSTMFRGDVATGGVLSQVLTSYGLPRDF